MFFNRCNFSDIGGIAGVRFGESNDIDGDAIITNCYSLGNITDSEAGGIVGAFVGGSNDHKVLIGNCYSFGSITNNGGGIAGASAFGGNLTIENCHAVNATGNGIGNNQIIKSEQQSGSTINNCSAGSGTWTPNLGTILKDNYTDSEGVLTDSNVWITSGGSFADGYGLTVFSTSPWNSSIYTSNSSIPEFGTNSSGSGSGKITIKLNGKVTAKGSGKITIK